MKFVKGTTKKKLVIPNTVMELSGFERGETVELHALTDTVVVLKKRMTASQQASELHTSNQAYEKLFREALPPGGVQICSLPLDKLVPFFTADIGFQPYTDAQLEAFAEQLKNSPRIIKKEEMSVELNENVRAEKMARLEKRLKEGSAASEEEKLDMKI